MSGYLESVLQLNFGEPEPAAVRPRRPSRFASTGAAEIVEEQVSALPLAGSMVRALVRKEPAAPYGTALSPLTAVPSEAGAPVYPPPVYPPQSSPAVTPVAPPPSAQPALTVNRISEHVDSVIQFDRRDPPPPQATPEPIAPAQPPATHADRVAALRVERIVREIPAQREASAVFRHQPASGPPREGGEVHPPPVSISAPIVKIAIGRVEIRSPQPAPRPQPPPPVPRTPAIRPARDLASYLRDRGGKS